MLFGSGRTQSAKATQSHIKATPKRVDSQPIGTPKPPEGYPKDTPRLPQSHPEAKAECRMQNAESRSKATQSQVQAKYKPCDWEGIRRYMRGTCVVQARLGTGACVGSGTRDGEAAGRKSERFRLFSRHYATRSEEHTSELQSLRHLVCR